MQTMFVLIKTYFNGEDDSTIPVKVFHHEAAGDTEAERLNGERMSSYCPKYHVEEIDVGDTLVPVAVEVQETARPINDRAKPNDILFDVTFTRMGNPHLVHIYAQTSDSAKHRVAAHYKLDLAEEATMSAHQPLAAAGLWRAENAEAIVSANEWTDTNGLPLAKQ